MNERRFHNYFGPSPRYSQACVEILFPLSADTCRIDHFAPALASFGITLVEPLPERALTQDEAVCVLAASLLSRHGSWWRAHGSEDTSARAAIGYPMSAIAQDALDIALDLVLGLGDIPATRDKIQKLAKALKTLSEPRLWTLEAARLHGRGNAEVSAEVEVYQIGEGARGVHFHRLGNQRDSFTGTMLEQSKHITAETLRRLDLPATRGVLVDSPEQAVAAIDRVGLPCVVKPVAMSRGAGVATHLTSAEQVAAAAKHALEISRRKVLVENHVEGHDHRLMVVEGELLWAYRLVPASVTGDGNTTVGDLIARENRRRAAIRGGMEGYLYPIPTGDGLKGFLQTRHGLEIDHILPHDETIDVSGQANVACGGVLHDVTGLVHPDNRALAIKTSRLFRIGTMGIDFVTPDVARSWREVPCAIVEVNRTPGISGPGDASLVHRTLFPQRLSGQVPTVAVIGDESYCAGMHAALDLAFAENGVGVATARYEGAADNLSVRTALLDPDAEAIVVLCAPARVEQSGLPLVRCDLLIVQDDARLGWLVPVAPEILRGAPSGAKLDHAIGKLARRYADPAGGGVLPPLEVVDGGADAFHLRVRRARAMPRGWFWDEVGTSVGDSEGLTTAQDLLAAVRALANGDGGSLAAFACPDLSGPWASATVDASLALPASGAGKARAALLAATAMVNAIVTRQL